MGKYKSLIPSIGLENNIYIVHHILHGKDVQHPKVFYSESDADSYIYSKAFVSSGDFCKAVCMDYTYLNDQSVMKDYIDILKKYFKKLGMYSRSGKDRTMYITKLDSIYSDYCYSKHSMSIGLETFEECLSFLGFIRCADGNCDCDKEYKIWYK